MGKKLTFPYIVIALLVICNIVLLYTNKKKVTESESTVSTLYPFSQKYIKLKTTIEQNIKYSSIQIPDHLITNNNKECTISSLFTSEEVILILRISERNCNTCVKYCINLMTNNTIDSQIPIIYLTGFKNDVQLNHKLQQIGLSETNSYNTEFLDIPIDNTGYPYIMVLNRNLQIEYCYFPTKDHEEIDIENINMIIDCYAEKL